MTSVSSTRRPGKVPRARRLATVGALTVAVTVIGSVGMWSAASVASDSPGGSADDRVTFVSPSSATDPASPDAPPRGKADSTDQPLAVVALGDSVPSANSCDCAGFVAGYAHFLAEETGQRVVAHNFARSAATSATIRDQVSDPILRDQLAAASTVVIMVGANDYVPAFRAVARGARPARTFRQVEDHVTANLTAVINTVRALHSGSDGVHIALLDYWNVVKDGAVAAREYTHHERLAAARATASANRAIARVAAATGAIDVSTFDPFESPKVNLTSLLAPDGDHPSAAGHRLIATVLFQALPRG